MSEMSWRGVCARHLVADISRSTSRGPAKPAFRAVGKPVLEAGAEGLMLKESPLSVTDKKALKRS
jgi:hypothetical protein